MFSYYGSKSKIVGYYPPPKYKKIIEPFAGSARYSLRFWQNDVLLVDKYSIIVRTWKWLQSCERNDILKLPIMKLGETLDDFNLTEDEKIFMGFVVQHGTTGLRKTVSSYAVDGIRQNLKNIADQLFKIKHWIIKEGDYRDLDNEDATWFIDPPYQHGGHEYKFSNKQIDFNELALWCQTRRGHIIVCENTKADWLPFKPMIDMQGAAFKTTEVIWSNKKTNYDDIQQSLFG
jgi:site-specific DNA-adenine methylase